ncbi:MAG: 3-phosphoserine/phosphohydroxythreonine transaminase [Saprospiraceae bacterium]|nr:3-phosphoserine/phosphohydroxythreonine transaminase [Saprospiraceae bacterium]
MKIHNFSPGPAVIPPSVLAEAADSLKEYQGTGMSFAEMSHRSPKIMAVIEEATDLVKELLSLTPDFEVIWMTGGASAQLAIAPMNLVNPQQAIAVVDTGYWATKAIKAAAQICKVHVLGSSKETNYDRIPKNWALPRGTQYFHVVSNETIDGNQYHEYPSVKVPLVADMTSDFLTKPLPLDKFGVIFASAQKNFGLAGTTCVIVRKDMLDRKVKRTIPHIFDYKTHVSTQSLYHTAATFPIYVSMLTLRWTKAQGGLAEMQRHNNEKATLLYDEIDRNALFTASIVKEDRSTMNACFRINQPELEQSFLDFAEQNGVVGIKGFPTVGDFRASMYNAMPLESVQILVDLMREFEQKIN